MTQRSERSSTGEESRGEKRRRKKMFYAKMKREEEDTLKELALKYRDRAKERRDATGGGDRPGVAIGPAGLADDPQGQGGYRAVAPDLKS